MTDSEQILKETLGPLLRAAFEGPAERRIGHLERLIIVARAIIRFAREIAPVVTPGANRESILRFTASALAPTVRELIERAGVDVAQGRVLIAAFALGLEDGAAEPDRKPTADEVERVRSLARILDFAQDLRARGLDRGGLRDRLARFTQGEIDPHADPSGRERQAELGRSAVDTILTSFFPPSA